MANVQHSTLTGSDLHEPKGIAAASANTVYVADGAASGAWTATTSLTITIDINGTAALTAPAVADEALVYDATAGANRKITLQDLFEIVNVFAEDTAPDQVADFVLTYDTSASTVKKVLPYRLSSYLTSGSMSGASLDLAIDTYTSYKTLVLILRDVVPATDGATPWLRVSDDGGATFEADASDYRWVHRSEELATVESNAVVGDGADSEIELSSGIGNASGEFCSITITIENPAGTSLNKMFHWNGLRLNASGANFALYGWGMFLANDDITDLRFMFSTGNITSGTYTLLGYV
jgi:hypothetical protein